MTACRLVLGHGLTLGWGGEKGERSGQCRSCFDSHREAMTKRNGVDERSHEAEARARLGQTTRRLAGHLSPPVHFLSPCTVVAGFVYVHMVHTYIAQQKDMIASSCQANRRQLIVSVWSVVTHGLYWSAACNKASPWPSSSPVPPPPALSLPVLLIAQAPFVLCR